MLLLYPLFLSLLSIAYAAVTKDYTSENFPNPKRMSNAKACNMRAASSVCDPYSVIY
jgi:hypothetical protein